MAWQGGASWTRPDPCMDKAGIWSREAAVLACYPDPRGCHDRLSTLESLGVERVCLNGPLEVVPGVGALGKGHSSIVFAAILRGSIVAVKSRRMDGRRPSLVGEARLLGEAGAAGVAPRLVAWSRDLIVMEYLAGPSLGEVLGAGSSVWALAEAVEAARILDMAGILHHELHRPWRNIYYTPTPSPKALVIDYESASRGCGNLAKIASALAHLGVIRVEGGVRRLLRLYKKNCVYDTILDVAGALLGVLEG
ncbi:MAG: hypothetical protein GSR86_00200 [Desulfurococcales archaeon]|nr:hypothetical protein [Desulfurococcales archaeon]